MTETEAVEFVRRAERVLRRWQGEIDRAAKGDARAEAMAARDSVLGTVLELGDDFPDLRGEVDRIASGYRFGIWAQRGKR